MTLNILHILEIFEIAVKWKGNKFALTGRNFSKNPHWKLQPDGTYTDTQPAYPVKENPGWKLLTDKKFSTMAEVNRVQQKYIDAMEALGYEYVTHAEVA